jgi:uncharacterized membrane protein
LNTEARPKIKIELSSTDKLIEIIGWLTLITLWGLTVLNYSNLPDTIPIHYNSLGQADNYGNKATIFMLPVIGTILFVGISILNKYPHILNYPTNITTDNARQQYANATRMIRYLKFAIVLIFSLIVFKTLQTATGKSDGLGTWFLPLALGLTFIPMTFYLIKLFKTKK